MLTEKPIFFPHKKMVEYTSASILHFIDDMISILRSFISLHKQCSLKPTMGSRFHSMLEKLLLPRKYVHAIR